MTSLSHRGQQVSSRILSYVLDPANKIDSDASIESPLKPRKSLGGLHNAWGTVGKKFTLRGRKRAQAGEALSAYKMEAHEAIELPDLAPDVYLDETCKSRESLPSSGFSSATRVSSSDSGSTPLLDRDSPDDPQRITIPKSTNSRKRYSEELTSDISCCSAENLRPARTTSKKVAFASITQLQLMEEAKQRQRAKSNGSNASGCPGPGSGQASEKEVVCQTQAWPAKSAISQQKLAEYGEK